MISRYIQAVKDFFQGIFGAITVKSGGYYAGILGFAKYLLRTDPKAKPEKIWCFYWEPYRKGLAATCIAGVLSLAGIATVLLTIGLITLLILAVAAVVYIIAIGVIIGGAVLGYKVGSSVNDKSDKEGGAPLIGIIGGGAAGVYAYQYIAAFGSGIWNSGLEVAENLNLFFVVTNFIGATWYWILGIVVFPVVVVFTIAALTIMTVNILKVFEKLVIYLYGIRNPCPVCSLPIEPAIYYCSECNEKHRHHLMPSQYGIFSHQCVNGHSLPTMLFGGRHKTPHHCPHCNTDLSSGAIGMDKHIAFVGGRTAGKTCLMIQSTRYMLKKGAEIPELDQQRDFELLKSRIEHGQVPDATSPKHIYRAFQMILKKGVFPYHLFFYDLAGEKFEHAQDAATHRFFATLDAVVFAFDPYSIPEFKQDHLPPAGVAVATQDPLELIRNLSQVIARYNSKGKAKKIVLNVLLVKSDTGYLNLFSSNHIVQGKSDSGEMIKQFIKAELGQGAFIHHIEQHFDKINYFQVSALGRIPDPQNTSPFVSQYLDEAFDRILKDIKVKV